MWSLPAGVVAVRLADLGKQESGDARRLEEVVGGPSDGVECVWELGVHGLGELDDAPSQHGCGERHGKVELHIVSRVIVTAY